MNTTLLVILGILVIVVVWFISLFNSLARRRNQIENAISSTDSLFIKRSDLIPNLISTVQNYMEFEQDTLQKITALRSMNMATNPAKEAQARKMLHNIMVQAEQYPELKSGEQFLYLQRSLNEVEEQISAGRRYISSSITDYNNATSVFPSNIIASMMGFKKYNWQYADTSQRDNVSAKDLFQSK